MRRPSKCLTVPRVIVPWTMAIWLTDAALDGPVRWAAIPHASGVIVVIAPVVVGIADADVETGRVDVEALRLYPGSRSNSIAPIKLSARVVFAKVRMMRSSSAGKITLSECVPFPIAILDN